MSRTNFDRRTFLYAAGIAGTTALAGCTDGSDGGDGGDSNHLDDEPDYSDWFDGANAYEGTVDRREEGEVTVEVGGGDGFAFEPAAIAVSPGTTVTWKWTGEGGMHDVTARDGGFESDLTDEEGHTFAHEFGDAGVHEYYCSPHETAGMRGIVYVEG